MPSKNIKQRNFMRAVLGYKEGKTKDVSDEIKKAAESMTKKQVLDFVKEEDMFVGESPKFIEELEEMYCSLSETKVIEHEKLGKTKLFNLDAMEELIADSAFLSKQYEKIKEKGKEIFGDHFKEIMLSFLFLKYVKNDQKQYNKYMELRNKKLDDYHKEKKSEVDETTTGGASGQYSSPVAFAKNDANWRFGKDGGVEGAKIIQPNTNKHVQGIHSYTIKEEFNKLINPDLLLESLESLDNKVKPSDIIIFNVNDTHNNFDDALQDKPKNFIIQFDIDKDGYDDELKIKFSFDDYINYILSKYEGYEKIKDNDQMVDTIIHDTVHNYLNEPIQHYILDNINKAVKVGENIEENDLYEHHIESRLDLTIFVLDHTDKYSEKELDNMTYDDLYKIYLDVEDSSPEFNKKEDGEKEIIVGGLEETKINENNNNTMNKENNKINEADSKPAALTLLDRLKNQNEKNEKAYFGDLNKGVQDQIKNPEQGGTFDYDYDKDSVKKDAIPAYREDVQPVADFVDDNRGRQLYDIDFDIPPTKKWLDMFRKQIGEENWAKFVKKRKQRALEKQYMRDVKTEVQPDHTKEMINIKDHANITENTEPKKPIMTTGYYLDKYNQKKFVNVDFNSDIVETNNETINESFTKLRFDGIGNKYSSKIEHSSFQVLNENVNNDINTYTYYINLSENKIVKTKTTIEESSKINESIVEEFKKILNYKTTDFYNNKNNHKPFDFENQIKKKK